MGRLTNDQKTFTIQAIIFLIVRFLEEGKFKEGIKKKGTQLRIPFLNLLLDYVPIKEEALPSLYETNVQMNF
jgi:hypothetical protein